MPNKTIKEGICQDPQINQLTWFEEALFFRLLVNCDDHGRFDARPEILKARLFPLKRDISKKTLENALRHISTVGLIDLYNSDGRPLLQLTVSDCYDISRRSKKSKYPEKNAGEGEVCEHLQANDFTCKQMISREKEKKLSPTPPLKKEKEFLNLSLSADAHAHTREIDFVPPTVDEVAEYCSEIGSSVSPSAFVDFYSSKNWTVGSTPMWDWRASVRMWEHRNREREKSGTLLRSAYQRDTSGITSSSFDGDEFLALAIKTSMGGEE